MAKDGYHHGDLKNALVDAALKAVEQGGPEAVSLRELAAQLGVSRAAPYRHFADREALLVAVAARGYQDLADGYEAALAGAADGMAALRAVVGVYIDFARRRRGLFRLDDFLSRDPPPAALIPQADRAYHLRCEAMRRAYPKADEATIKARVITSWSTIFGFLTLDRARRFKDFMIRPLTRDRLTEAVIDAATRFGGG